MHVGAKAGASPGIGGRVLRILLAIVLAVGFVPISPGKALAGSGLGEMILEVADYACYIDADKDGSFSTGDAKYETVQAAVDHVTAGQVIRMIKDSNEDIVVAADDKLTLDLDGFVLEGTGNGSVIANYGELSITDRNASSTAHCFVVHESGLWVLDEGKSADEATYTFSAVDGLKKAGAAASDIPANGSVIAVSGGCITGGSGTGIFDTGTGLCPGGGIRNLQGATLTLASGYVIGNRCVNDGNGHSSEGGGIRNAGTVTISGGAVCGNSVTGDSGSDADNYAGGIYNVGTLAVSNGSVCYNTVSGDGQDCLSYGAGIYNGAGSTVTVSGGSIVGNAGAYSGGGINNCGTVAISNTARITKNQTCYQGYGAGIANISGGTVTVSGGSISGNSGTFGVGIYNGDASTVTVSGGSVSENEGLHGAGIYNGEGGTFTMDGGSVSGNKGTYGAGIRNDGTLYIKGSAAIDGNEATFGGGMYAAKGTVSMTGGSIAENTGENYGGGVYVYGGTFTMGGGSVTANKSPDSGGGVYVYGGTFTMGGGSVSGNKADGYGGGVYVDKGTFTMDGGAVSKNWAGYYGGGVYNDNVFAMTGGSISENETSWSYGGGVYNGKAFTMTGGSISENKTLYSHGCGVYAGEGGATMDVGGTASIAGNTQKNYNITDNLYLPAGVTVSISTDTPLASGASIGVTTKNAPTASASVQFTSNGSKTDEAYFFSDSQTCADKYNSNGYLELVVGSTVTEAACENGSVSVGDAKSYYAGETVTVTATPDMGYSLGAVKVAKTDGGADVTSEVGYNEATGTFTMPAYDVTVSATFEGIPEVAQARYSASLTLDSAISVKMRISQLGTDGAGAGFEADKLSVSVGGTPLAAGAIAYEDGTATCTLKSVSPLEIGTTFEVVVSYDGIPAKVFGYSPAKYCTSVAGAQLGGTVTQELQDLCKAVLNYGAWAENYYNGDTASTTAGKYAIDFSSYAGLSGEPAEPTVTLGSDVEQAKASLTLESTVCINFKVKLKDEGGSIDAEDVTILNGDGQKVAAGSIAVKELEGADAGWWQVSVEDIYACQLPRTYTLTVDGLGKFKIAGYGVYTYCASQAGEGSGATETLQKLCKALHNYGEKAAAYQASKA